MIKQDERERKKPKAGRSPRSTAGLGRWRPAAHRGGPSDTCGCLRGLPVEHTDQSHRTGTGWAPAVLERRRLQRRLQALGTWQSWKQSEAESWDRRTMAERDFYDSSLTLRVLHTVHFDPNRASKSAFLRKTLILFRSF